MDHFLKQQPEDPVLATPLKKTGPGKKRKIESVPKKTMKAPTKKAMKAPSPKKAMKAMKKAMKQKPLAQSSGFIMMFYKHGPAYAVRKKKGKQLFQITTLHKSPSKVRQTCQMAMDKLDNGESPSKVKTWAKAQWG